MNGRNKMNTTTISKVLYKCDSIDGSFLNGDRETTLHSFTLDKPPGFIIYFE